MIDISINAPEEFQLWSNTVITIEKLNNIYYTVGPGQCTSSCSGTIPPFWMFNTINKTYIQLSNIPSGYGLSCFTKIKNETDQLWYIYSIGGTPVGFHPKLKNIYVCILYILYINIVICIFI